MKKLNLSISSKSNYSKQESVFTHNETKLKKQSSEAKVVATTSSYSFKQEMEQSQLASKRERVVMNKKTREYFGEKPTAPSVEQNPISSNKMVNAMKIQMSNQVIQKTMEFGLSVESSMVVAASKARGDALEFRQAKKQVLVEAAMKTMNNPLFTQEMEKDIANQIKYFEQDPPPVPNEWMKEGEYMRLQERLGMSDNLEHSVEKIQDLPIQLVQQIVIDYKLIKSINVKAQKDLNAYRSKSSNLFARLPSGMSSGFKNRTLRRQATKLFYQQRSKKQQSEGSDYWDEKIEPQLFAISQYAQNNAQNSNMKNILCKIIQAFEHINVAVFKPHGNFNCYTMQFCESNLQLLYLELVGKDGVTEQLVGKDVVIKRQKDSDNYNDSDESENMNAEVAYDEESCEFINIFEIFLASGIVPSIKMNKLLLDVINKKGISQLTEGWLKNKKLRNEDLLLLRYNNFERILVFERFEKSAEKRFDSDQESNSSDSDPFNGTKKSEEDEKPDDEEEVPIVNTNKQQFLRILHLLMTIASFSDESREGELAIYKKVNRPSYVDLDAIIAQQTEENKIEAQFMKKPKVQHVNFSIENLQVSSFNPNDELEDVLKMDENVNQSHKINPGRLSIQVNLLINLMNHTSFDSRTTPLVFEAYLLDKECFTEQDSSIFLMLKQGHIKEFFQYREIQRQQALKSNQNSFEFFNKNRRFTQAIVTQVSEFTKKYNVGPLIELQLRNLISEKCVPAVLKHEHWSYSRIMSNLYMIKLRGNANAGFHKWFMKRARKNEEKKVNCEQTLTNLSQFYLSQNPSDSKEIQESREYLFTQRKAKGIELLRKKLETQEWFTQIETSELEEQYDITFEIKYWRIIHELRMVEKEIYAVAPMIELLSIADAQSAQPKRSQSGVELLRLNTSQLGISYQSSQQSAERKRKAWAGGTEESKEFGRMSKIQESRLAQDRLAQDRQKKEQNYHKLLNLKASTEQDKLKAHIKQVRLRLSNGENKSVNPLLDTFDLLHLQEMSLVNKKSNRPERVKNNNSSNPVTGKRHGGHKKKIYRKKLDNLIKFGYRKTDKTILLRGGSTDSHKSVIGMERRDLRVITNDPIEKIQRTLFNDHKIGQRSKSVQQSKITLTMNVIEYVSRKRHRKHLKARKAAHKPGSEAFWNPESKKRIKVVKNVVQTLRKKRQELENQLSDDADEDNEADTRRDHDQQQKLEGSSLESSGVQAAKLAQARRDLQRRTINKQSSKNNDYPIGGLVKNAGNRRSAFPLPIGMSNMKHERNETIIELGNMENSSTNSRLNQSNGTSLLHTDRGSLINDFLSQKSKINNKQQSYRTQSIMKEINETESALGNSQESYDDDSNRNTDTFKIVLGAGELVRETVMLDYEDDNLPNFMKKIEKKANKKLSKKQKNDRKVYEDRPGQYMGIEHYISSDVRKQRGHLKLDMDKVGLKTNQGNDKFSSDMLAKAISGLGGNGRSRMLQDLPDKNDTERSHFEVKYEDAVKQAAPMRRFGVDRKNRKKEGEEDGQAVNYGNINMFEKKDQGSRVPLLSEFQLNFVEGTDEYFERQNVQSRSSEDIMQGRISELIEKPPKEDERACKNCNIF